MKKYALFILLLFSLLSVHAGGPWTRLIEPNLTGSVNSPSPYILWYNNTNAAGLEEWYTFDGRRGDGNVGSGDWEISSGGLAKSSYVTIDLGSANATAIQSYNVSTSLYNGSRTLDPIGWKFEGSNDNSTYTLLRYENTSNWTNGENPRQFNFTNNVSYRYYRFQVMNVSGGGASTVFLLGEMTLLRDFVPSSNLSQLNISVNNIVNGSAISTFCMIATGTNTTQGICTVNNTVFVTTIGTYNITAYNIGLGNVSNQTVDAHNVSSSGTDSVQTMNGITIIANRNVTLLNFGKFTTTVTSRAYLLDASKNVLVNTTYSSNIATINYNLTAGTTYYLTDDNSGAFYTRTFTGLTTFPISGTNINFTGGLNNNIDDPFRILDIVNVTTNRAPGIYFDQTVQNFVFSSNTNLTFNATQAYINLSAYRLYLNTSITNFNVTNNLASNKTGSTSFYLVPANNGSNNLQVDVGGNFSTNLTCTITSPLSTAFCNATGIYDNRYTIGTTPNSNFSVSVNNTALGGQLANISTTNGSAVISLLQGYLYSFMIQPNGFAFQNATLPTNASTHLFNFSLQNTNTLNLTFIDEENGSIVNGNGSPNNGPTISVNLISASFSTNKTTNNGTLYFTALTPGTYTIQYTAPNYSLKLYQFVLTNNTYTALSLAMLRSSSATSVTVTAVDSTGRTQSNVTVEVLRYNIATNSYNIVESLITDANGVGQFDAVLNSVFYYFIVLDPSNTIVLQTSPSILYSNTVQLTILNFNTGLNNIINDINIMATITYNTTTNIARYTYIDTDNAATQGCLYTYQITPTNKVLYNSSCANSASSTLTSPITNTSGSYWLFQGIVTKHGVTYLVSTLSESFQNTFAQDQRNKTGLFILLILELIVIAIFRYDLRIMVIVGSILPMLFSMTSFSPIGLGYTVPIFILGVIIAYIIGT